MSKPLIIIVCVWGFIAPKQCWLALEKLGKVNFTWAGKLQNNFMDLNAHLNYRGNLSRELRAIWCCLGGVNQIYSMPWLPLFLIVLLVLEIFNKH